jgi:hypothetical protein
MAVLDCVLCNIYVCHNIHSGMDTIKVIVFSVTDKGHRLEKDIYIYCS